MADEVFYMQQDQEGYSSDSSEKMEEIVYLLQVPIHNWKGRTCSTEYIMKPVTKDQYIRYLLKGEEYLCCTKNGKKWGIKTKLIDTWVIHTDTAKYEVWHGKVYEDVPENHLFKFLLGTRAFATTFVDAPKVIEFLTSHFEDLFNLNKNGIED